MSLPKLKYLIYLFKRQSILPIIKKTLLQLFGFVVLWPIAQLIPRNKSLWLIGGGHTGFNGNAKFLYFNLKDKHPEISSVWMADSKVEKFELTKLGVSVFYRWSLQGIYMSLRAGVYFTNNYSSDINYFTLGKALYFNLWHGVGLKQIEFGITEGVVAKAYDTKNFVSRFFIPYHFKRPDLFLSTSPAMTTHFAKSFRITEQQCLQLKGYPRNELFFHDKGYVKDWVATHEKESCICFINDISVYKRSIIYMPTWRDKTRDLIQDAGLDFERLNEVMKVTNSVFIFKLHPATSIDLSILDNYSNLMAFDAVSDVYTVLPFIDVLITDYSSIYHDFILLKEKQVLLFPYDLVRSNKKEAGITLQEDTDYEKMMPGKRAYNFTELCDYLISEEIYYFENIDSILDVFWRVTDSNASKAIVDYVSNYLKQ